MPDKVLKPAISSFQRLKQTHYIGRTGRIYPRLWLTELFIGSLCLLNIKILGFSLPLYIGGFMVVYEILNIYLNYKKIFDSLDIIFAAYFILCFSAFEISADPLLIYKLISYYFIFVALKSNISSSTDLWSPILRGAIIGVFLIICLFFYAFYTGKITIADIMNFSYYNVTYALYKDFLSGDEVNSFEGRDIMRNTLAEAFSLYFLLLYTAGRFFTAFVSVIGVFIFQSRRAMLSVALGAIFARGFDKLKLIVILIVALLGFAASVYLTTVSVETRYGDLSSAERIKQFWIVFNLLAENPLTGYGYGQQVLDKYVHNFLLSSWFMLGFAGLVLAILFWARMSVYFFRSGDLKWLLSIPFIGMAVGATVEGMITLTGWTAIAIARECRNRTLINKSEKFSARLK